MVAAILMLTASLFAAPPTWTASNFRGLTLGRAHREDALRTLGTPDADSRTSNGEELLYKTRGSHKGDLTVRLDRSGIVTEIQESLPVAIPRTKALPGVRQGCTDRTLLAGQVRRRCVLSRPRAVPLNSRFIRRAASFSGPISTVTTSPPFLYVAQAPLDLTGLRPAFPGTEPRAGGQLASKLFGGGAPCAYDFSLCSIDTSDLRLQVSQILPRPSAAFPSKAAWSPPIPPHTPLLLIITRWSDT